MSNPKQLFLKDINDKRKNKNTEISLRLESFIRQLQNNPKSSYNLQDIDQVIHLIKISLIKLNDQIFQEFSIDGIKLMSAGVSLSAEEIAAAVDSDEADYVRKELIDTKKKLAETEIRLNELTASPSEISLLREEMAKKDGHLEELQTNIITIRDKYEAQLTNLTERVTEYMGELNKVQESEDELKRSNVKLRDELENVGSEIMKQQLEMDSYKTTLAERDNQLDELKSASRERDMLKDKIVKAATKLDQITKENQELKKREIALKELASQVNPEIETEMAILKENIANLESKTSKIEEENTLLIEEQADTARDILKYKKLVSEKEKQLKDIASSQKIGEEAQAIIDSQKEKNLIQEKSIGDLRIENREILNKLESVKSELNSKVMNQELELKQSKKWLDDERKKVSENVKTISELRLKLDQLSHHEADLESLKSSSQSKIDSLNNQISNIEKQLKESDSKIEEQKMKLDLSQKEIASFEKRLTRSKDKVEQYKENITQMKTYLEESPKYQVLFVISDLKKVKIEELQKALALSPAAVSRTIKTLESEGWIEIDDNNVITQLKDFLPT